MKDESHKDDGRVLRGTRYGDFSRFIFDPKKNYSSVHMQQGRVQLDSDWNAQASLTENRQRLEAIDAIGPVGAPGEAAGFGLEIETGFECGPNKAYLIVGGEDGILWSDAPEPTGELTYEIDCVADSPGILFSRWTRHPETGRFTYRAEQLEWDGRSCLRLHSFPNDIEPPRTLHADLDGPTLRSRSRVRMIFGREKVSLYVDEKLVGESTDISPAWDYAAIPSVLHLGAGLGVQESQSILRGVYYEFRLWTRSLQPGAQTPEPPPTLNLWDRRMDEMRTRKSGRFPCSDISIERLGEKTPWRLDPYLTAGRYWVDGVLCVNETKTQYSRQPDLPGEAFPPLQPARRFLFYLDVWQREISYLQDEILREKALGGPSTTTRSQIVAQVKNEPLRDDEEASAALDRLQKKRERSRTLRLSYQSQTPADLSNRLYRVEIHRAGDEATFKWSRNNASLELGVVQVVGASPNPDEMVLVVPRIPTELLLNDWVEPVDDVTALRGPVQPLCQVVNLDPQKSQITLKPAPKINLEGPGGLLRSWGNLSPSRRKVFPREQGIPIKADTWQELEDGIRVRFEDGAQYFSGDYWWILTRPAGGRGQMVQWPGGGQAEHEPFGVGHAYAPIAQLDYSEEGFVLSDLRPIFEPRVYGEVRKQGPEEMTGPLTIKENLEVLGDIYAHGQIRSEAGYLGPVLGCEVVDTQQLADSSVTEEKLSEGLGVVPVGYCILGANGKATPPGWVDTGSTLTADHRDQPWRLRKEDPGGPQGGCVSVQAGGRIYSFFETGDVWKFDPRDDSLETLEDLPIYRRRFACAAIGEMIYLVGGVDASGKACGDLLRFDVSSETWCDLRSMPTARSELAAVGWEGKLHVFGGLTDGLFGERISAAHEVYDPGLNSWTRQRSMQAPRAGLAAAALPDRIDLVGGEKRWFFGLWGRMLTRQHHQYLPKSRRWLKRAPLPSPRRDLGWLEVGGRLWAVGGRGAFGWLTNCDRYDPAADSWQPAQSFDHPPVSPGVAGSAGELYAAGPIDDCVQIRSTLVSQQFSVLSFQPGSAARASDLSDQDLRK